MDETAFDLARLLAPVEPEAFFRDTWEKQPLAVARNDPDYYHGLFSLRDAEPQAPAPGRVPRVARLLALAHRLERLLRAGVVRDYAGAARLGRVTRAWVSQVMGLLYLAPDLQEQVLFMPRTERGRDAVRMRDLLPVAAAIDWRRQRRLWAALRPGGPRA